MEALNHALFLWLNAPAHPHPAVAALAIFLAEYLIWLAPALIGLYWLRGGEASRKAMLSACVACLLGLLFSQLIGLLWPHPRPFTLGLGHALISHAADASFPSDHLTLWWSLAFGLWWQRGFARIGALLALLGVGMAWARVFVGVHFPLDMAGALAVAGLSAWLSLSMANRYLPAAYALASRTHRALFRPLIRLGWLRE